MLLLWLIETVGQRELYQVGSGKRRIGKNLSIASSRSLAGVCQVLCAWPPGVARPGGRSVGTSWRSVAPSPHESADEDGGRRMCTASDLGSTCWIAKSRRTCLRLEGGISPRPPPPQRRAIHTILVAVLLRGMRPSSGSANS